MPIKDKNEDKMISLIKMEAAKYKATIKKIDLKNQIIDIDCPEDNKDECAVAIQQVLDKAFGEG